MGLFGSKTKTQVGTQVQRVLEDDALPNSVREGFIENLFDGEADQQTEYAMDHLANSIALRASRMYEFGEKSYIFGLPQSTLKSSSMGRDATLATLRTLYGGSTQLSYYHFGPLNNLHLAWMVLVNQHGYIAGSNKLTNLSAQKQTDVFLSDMQVVVTDAMLDELANGSLDQWGDPPNAGPAPVRPMLGIAVGQHGKATPFAVDPSAPGDYVKVTYCWEETIIKVVEGVNVPIKQTKEDSFSIPMTGYDFLADYHQARYVAANGKVDYWIYEAGTGQYPTIDAIFDTEYSGTGSFFPFAYLRYDKKSGVADENSAEYKSSVKLLKYLNMDFQSVAEAVNENPDIADVEQAMVMMAVPAVTSSPMEQRYLFDFFHSVQQGTSSYANNNKFDLDVLNKQALGADVPSTGIIIQDKRFKMALNYNSVVKRGVAGSIGPIGTYSSGFGVVENTVDVPVVGGGTKPWTNTVKTHWYRHQVTESVYEEIKVYGLKMTYYIFEQYTTTGDEDDDILLIPLDQNITKEYSVSKREVLYSRSLHYVFNSRVVTKLKWYQTGLFRAIMIIVAIVVTVLSYGSTWQTLGAAVAAGTITISQLVIMLLIGALKYLLVSLAIKLFVKAVGAKIAFIAAIVAAIAGVTVAIDNGSFASSPWAKDLLTVSTSLAQGVNNQLKVDFNDLLAQQTEFEKYVKEQTKTLEDAQNLLDESNTLNPLLIFGESSNDFYQRTVHSGNIGVLGIEAVESYVDVALQLPKLNETMNL